MTRPTVFFTEEPFGRSVADHYLHTHHDTAPDEVFLGNMSLQNFANIGWTTKRRGEGAELFPAFAKRAELVGAGIRIQQN